MTLSAFFLAAAGVFAAEGPRAPLSGPETWLNLMGGNVRKDGLRCDLEAIKEAGLSGIHFFHVQRSDAGVWPGCEKQIPCMSEDWFDVIRFLGEECSRLGLGLTIQNCPGWSQSGGPWIGLGHCQRDIEVARRDFTGGDAYAIPDVPDRFRDADSDWRDVAVLAFRTPHGDTVHDVLKPSSREGRGTVRVYRFDSPVTLRSFDLQPCDTWNPAYSYNQPWVRVKLEAEEAGHGWREVIRVPVPVSNWRDYVLPLTVACGEVTAKAFRVSVEHDRRIRRFADPVFRSSARHTDWQSKSARTLRSLIRRDDPPQPPRTWIDPSTLVDLTGLDGWKVPAGRWTVLRFGHVNAKRVNSPAPREATGWECDKLDPAGIEASFDGYVRRLGEGVLKGRMRAMLVDSWECFGQTWTPKMERYFRERAGYPLRLWLPALFGWIIGSPAGTERFLTDWRRINGSLITENYYGRMASLARDAGLEVYYETAFGDIIHGDLLEYWKYSDAPMCEFWSPHTSTEAEAFVGCHAFKPVRPCASAAHIYGKRRVVAEAFTGWGISWREDFRLLQDVANRHFARGVTHLALQSYTHAPDPEGLPPGGCMGGYNGTPFTRLQTWWKFMPEFSGWLRRCEEFLEAGLPSADVLWYLGDAVDHKPDVDYPFPEGYSYDYLNHDVLTNRLSVRNSRFTVPEGTTWSVLWVPDEYMMLPATRAALDRLEAVGGKIVCGGKDALVKALSAVRRDVTVEPSLGDGPSEDFMWLHRHVDGYERYFVASGTNGFAGRVSFRAEGPVSVYDPVSLERRGWTNGGVLEIPPSRSLFVEFGISAPADGVQEAKSRIEIKGWTLGFQPGWGAPERLRLDVPVSWTELPGVSAEARAYSGSAVYEADFDVPASSGKVTRAALVFSRVESLVRVFVNDREVRTLWCEPYRCEIGAFIRPGRNRLRLEAVNTWHNRVVYDLGQDAAKRKTWMLHRRNHGPDAKTPLVPAGVIGGVYVDLYREKSLGPATVIFK